MEHDASPSVFMTYRFEEMHLAVAKMICDL
jgi:hypothetical protein